MSSRSLTHYQRCLEKKFEQNNYRERLCLNSFSPHRIVEFHKPSINFSSNDYLVLSQHPEVKKRAMEYLVNKGSLSSHSFFNKAQRDSQQRLEKKLSALLQFDTALFFTTRFQAHQSTLGTLVDAQAQIFIDRACHYSLFQNVLTSKAKLFIYPHLDYETLKTLLATSGPAFPKILISESLFGMDGDIADLDLLIQIAQEFNGLLYIDDTNSIGTMGRLGMGLGAGHPGIDVLIGTLGKACGSFGAYLATSELIKDYLVNFCPGFIQATSLSPAILGAVDATLDLIPSMIKMREELTEKGHYLRSHLQALGFSTLKSSSHIIPILVPKQEIASLAQFLQEKGILCGILRPPTLGEEESRLRFSLNVLHTEQHIQFLIDALKEWVEAQSTKESSFASRIHSGTEA